MAEIYNLKFVWRQEDGRFKVVYCDEGDVPKDADGFPYAFWKLPQFLIDDYYLQWTKNELTSNFEILNQYAASVTVNKKQVVRFPRGRFLYMDVGRWLNGKQSFGLVCGDDAVLCAYDPGTSPAVPADKTGVKILDAVLGITGVSVLSRKKILGPKPPDSDRLMVILPDMHVPKAPPLEMARPENLEGYGPLKFGYWRDDPNTFESLGKYDYFNSRASIQAMIRFLKALRQIDSSNVVLVQIGDMYELWAGHSLEYVQTDAKHPVVNLKSAHSAENVGTWLAMIHDMHDELFEQFDLCDEKMMTMFLHGNHDSYLSCPEVVIAANKEIESRCELHVWGNYSRKVFKKTKVFPRVREINYYGVFMEHGQRADMANRDGETLGQLKTNEAFESPGMWKKWVGDTIRRRSFVTGAAAQWMVRGQDFGLYVMGHTHDPELKYIDVVHVQGSITYSGAAGQVVIKATNDL